MSSEPEEGEVVQDRSRFQGKVRKSNTSVHTMISSNYKTKVCEHYKKGACKAGEKCSFKHPVEFQNVQRMCKFFLGGSCSTHHCAFNHDTQKYQCKYHFVVGHCNRENPCRFSHDPWENELQKQQWIADNENFILDHFNKRQKTNLGPDVDETFRKKQFENPTQQQIQQQQAMQRQNNGFAYSMMNQQRLVHPFYSYVPSPMNQQYHQPSQSYAQGSQILQLIQPPNHTPTAQPQQLWTMMAPTINPYAPPTAWPVIPQETKRNPHNSSEMEKISDINESLSSSSEFEVQKPIAPHPPHASRKKQQIKQIKKQKKKFKKTLEFQRRQKQQQYQQQQIDQKMSENNNIFKQRDNNQRSDMLAKQMEEQAQEFSQTTLFGFPIRQNIIKYFFKL